MIRHLLDAYNKPVPAILEIPSKVGCRRSSWMWAMRCEAGTVWCSQADPGPLGCGCCAQVWVCQGKVGWMACRFWSAGWGRWHACMPPDSCHCAAQSLQDAPYDPSQDSVLQRVRFMFGES